MESNAFGRELSEEEIRQGEHRRLVGGLWEEIGRLQLEFLVRRGLRKDMRFLDIGCGALRGGVHFIRYLDPGNYYGVETNASLLKAGLGVEVKAAGLEDRVARENLLLEPHFDFSRFQVQFHMALALSVFTHLTLNYVSLCLIRLAEAMVPGGSFYATFFECPEESRADSALTHYPGNVTTYLHQDPYHYKVSNLRDLARGLPWEFDYIGEWHHPRAQRMIRFVRR